MEIKEWQLNNYSKKFHVKYIIVATKEEQKVEDDAKKIPWHFSSYMALTISKDKMFKKLSIRVIYINHLTSNHGCPGKMSIFKVVTINRRVTKQEDVCKWRMT